MPGYRTHVVGGSITYIIAIALLYKFYLMKVAIFTALKWFMLCILGSLFPDVDIKSRGQNIFYPVVVLALFILLWKKKMTEFVVVSLLSFVPLLVQHRGLFHNVWFIIAVSGAVALVASSYQYGTQQALLYDAFFFAAGAISHIILDQCQTRLGLS